MKNYRKDYRASHIEPGKGVAYHDLFNSNPFVSAVWELEMEILHSIFRKHFEHGPASHLDFACGTGRVLRCLEDLSSNSVGMDISAEMLAVARENSPDLEIVEADLTKSDIMKGRKFDIITAFRFFPNAENELRDAAMRVLFEHLNNGGIVVFNNHRNLQSLRYRIARLLNRGKGEGMSTIEALNLIRDHNFVIEKVFSTCVLPASEQRRLLPKWAFKPIERALARLPAIWRISENQIFVCSKNQELRGDT